MDFNASKDILKADGYVGKDGMKFDQPCESSSCQQLAIDDSDRDLRSVKARRRDKWDKGVTRKR